MGMRVLDRENAGQEKGGASKPLNLCLYMHNSMVINKPLGVTQLYNKFLPLFLM